MNLYRPDLTRLGRELGEIYDTSPRGEKLTALHLFGIVHAAEMSALTKRELEEVAAVARLSPSFSTELRKMIKLSRFVVPRDQGGDAGVVARATPQGSVFDRLARPMPPAFRFDREEANARR